MNFRATFDRPRGTFKTASEQNKGVALLVYFHVVLIATLEFSFQRFDNRKRDFDAKAVLVINLEIIIFVKIGF